MHTYSSGIHPPDNHTLRELLNKMAEDKVNPCAPKRPFRTISWLARTLQSPDSTKDPALKAKLRTIRISLTYHLATEDHRAHLPSTDVVKAFENATTTSPTCQEKQAAAAFRWMAGAACRYSDAQHANIPAHQDNPDTIELTAWTTKPRDVLASHCRPARLIPPPPSFAHGHTLVEHTQRLHPGRRHLAGHPEQGLPSPRFGPTLYVLGPAPMPQLQSPPRATPHTHGH